MLGRINMSLLRNKYFNFFVFVFFTVLVFITFRDLFSSYFEADEWFHFTNYLPLTRQPFGFLSTILKTVTDTDLLSRGQHVVPIGEEIFFLNTFFFGTNYTPYIFLSLLLHSINSFLVFLFVKELLPSREKSQATLFALLGGIFFALSQIHFHAVAWAAFYGQNNLSVTFFLLCILFLKKAFNTKKKNFLYLSLLFLFLDLFTKETATALFFVLPFMALIEKRIFSFKFLAKLFAFSLIVFIIFRFIVPNVYLGLGHLADKWVDNYISSANKITGNKDTGTIVSTDLSIHKNIYAELLFRAITFPVKMTSEFYFPRETILLLVSVITPVIYPQPGGGDEQVRSQYRQFFLNGPGNDLLIYILSVSIVLFLIYLAKRFYKNKKTQELQAIGTGLAIIFFGAMPLVLIVLSFPRWGYDTYFDSRHYYMPSVGAAILFSFLLFGMGQFISKFLSKLLRFRMSLFITVSLLFSIWLINNINALNTSLDIMVKISGSPRRQVIKQLKQNVPILPQKAVFFVQTDGFGAYGELLPFQTPFPQILTVVYYDKNPLPDSFFSKFFLDGKPEGYLYSQGRGLGFYNSKKTLSESLLTNKFSVDDIYAFYYDSQKIKLKNTTREVKAEMSKYLLDANKNQNWEIYEDPVLKLTFKYPTDTKLNDISHSVENPKILKMLEIGNSQFSAQIRVFSFSPGLDVNEMGTLVNGGSGETVQKKVFFDKFHFNDAVVVTQISRKEYFIKLADKLLYVVAQNNSEESLNLIEKILGSITVVM